MITVIIIVVAGGHHMMIGINMMYLDEERQKGFFPFNKKDYKEFIKFLIKKGCYHEYLYNLQKSLFGKRYLTKALPSRFYVDSFTWISTKEGHIYWAKINYEWVNIVKGYLSKK